MKTAKARLALANVEQEDGDLARALEHSRAGRDVYAEVAPDSLDLARAEELIGVVAFRSRRFADALEAYERALAIEQRRSAGGLHVALTLYNIAEVLVELRRFDQAMSTAAEVERILGGQTAVPPELEALPLKVRGLAFLGEGRAREAVPALERALALLESQQGYPMETADVLFGLARALWRASRASAPRARSLAERALALYRARGEEAAAQRGAVAAWLAALPRR